LYNSGPVGSAGSKVRLALASDEWLVACVRRGDTAAFETIYDRHIRELLAFSMYMLGSKHDAEDAVQMTFASAYRALRGDSRPVTLRPWLFTIARNDCLTILRRRRQVVELNNEIAQGPDPVDELELREEVRKVFAGLRDLPENQRAALVMAEVHGLSHQEIGGVLGVRAEQVKAYVFQARSKLLSDRRARDADCHDIREELATARGAALLRGRLRRHLRACPDCRLYADGVARQRRQLGALLPIAPSLALKYRAIEEAANIGATEPTNIAGGAAVGASAAGAAADLAGGGMKVLVCKLAAGMVCLGAGAGVGVSVLESPNASQGAATAGTASGAALVASANGPGGSAGWTATLPAFAHELEGGSGAHRGGMTDSGLPVVENGAGGAPGVAGVKDGPQVTDRNGHGQTDTGGDRAGGTDHFEAGRNLHERSDPTSDRETQHQSTHERLLLRREAKERSSSERKLAHEKSKPGRGSGIPPTEQELAEKRQQHKTHVEENRPEGHSRIPPTAEELAEKRAHRKQKLAERRHRREEEEERALAEKEAAAGP
jgi:RNA polymerase sigma factor (sigma-70 family)